MGILNKAKDHNLPKGSVLIVEDQIKTMWQDNEEPENCVNKEKTLIVWVIV